MLQGKVDFTPWCPQSCVLSSIEAVGENKVSTVENDIWFTDDAVESALIANESIEKAMRGE